MTESMDEFINSENIKRGKNQINHS